MTLLLLCAVLIPSAIPATAGGTSLALVAVQAEPETFERPYRDSTRRAVRSVRGWFRGFYRTIVRALKVWIRWFARAALFVVVVLFVAVFDRRLIETWRAQGLGALRTYVPLMVHTTTSLFLSSRVPTVGKLLLAFTVGYGAMRSDIFPDRTLLPGLADDLLLVFLATRTFLATCPDEETSRAARRAIAWQRRVEGIRRRRARRPPAVRPEDQ